MILHDVTRGEGPALVLLHGLFGQAANFATLQRRLAARFRVLALDLRNHGASAHAPSMDYGTMAEDVLETLRRHDALPCAMVGHSMGGKVAMTAALAAPHAVSRLLVGDIAPVRYAPAHQAYAAAMAAIPLHSSLTRAQADAALAETMPAADIRAFLLQNLRFGAMPAWRIGLAEIAAGLADIEDWPAPPDGPYLGPVLFVAGERSNYIRAAHRPAIRALFPAARFVTLKGAGHWLHADAPAAFAAVVEGFLG
jgi:esterase